MASVWEVLVVKLKVAALVMFRKFPADVLNTAYSPSPSPVPGAPVEMQMILPRRFQPSLVWFNGTAWAEAAGSAVVAPIVTLNPATGLAVPVVE
jgi:hypothetical protein